MAAIYVDASALLRVLLRQPGALEPLRSAALVSSSIIEVEALRTIDRVRLHNRLSAAEAIEQREAVYAALTKITLVELDRPVIERASQPLTVPLRTLDSLHLATALVWRERSAQFEPLRFATHDGDLAAAARAHGFEVVGT